jgi:hypothetical protein
MRGMNWTQISLASVITFVITWLVRPYIGSYLNKKGENRAIHEDIDKINRQLETIKSEFSLKLDFYKVVYPEKVKAAIDLHHRAAKLFMDLPQYFVGAQDKERAVQLERMAIDMWWQAKSYEVLLGEDVVRLTNNYRMICVRAFLLDREFRDLPAIGAGDIWAHEGSFKELAMALRRALHLDMLDALMSSAEGNAPSKPID